MNGVEINSDECTLVDFLKSDDPDLFAKAWAFTAFLEDWKSKGTYSYHRVLTTACTNRTIIRDEATGARRPMISFASNNYLGLSTRAEVIQAAQGALARYGSGLCGSRFLSGTSELVVELERILAEFEHCEDAVVFTSGYQANVGAISALMRPGDAVYLDRLSHASIVDGCRLSGCELRVFRHNDVAHLARLLARTAGKYRGKLIIVDGVFSMDGDLAPLPDLVALALKFGARIMVDEAHATGVLGSTGRGTIEHFKMENEIDLVLGTFSKTLSATGGFVAGSRPIINYLRQYGRSYVFSASPTPATIAAVVAGMQIIQNEPHLREKLWDNIGYLHQGLKRNGFCVFPDPPQSAIMTIRIGADTVVRNVSKSLYEAGVFASVVVYPAVPLNEGTLRLSVSALHTRQDLDEALEKLSAVGRQYGII